MCGVRTNIVTAVEIRDKDASDTKLLPALADATAKNLRLDEVSADKGYGSIKNYKAIQRHGATPYIAFKSIHTGQAEGLRHPCTTSIISTAKSSFGLTTNGATSSPRSQ